MIRFQLYCRRCKRTTWHATDGRPPRFTHRWALLWAIGWAIHRLIDPPESITCLRRDHGDDDA